MNNMDLSKILYKKDEVFQHEYFLIMYNNFYLTDEFITALYKNNSELWKTIVISNSTIIKTNIVFNIDYKKTKTDINIFFRDAYFSTNDFSKYKWKLCGDGVHCSLNANKFLFSDFDLNIKQRMKVYKNMVALYMDSSIARAEKLNDIFNNS